MTSKKPASSKRAAPPRACDYTKTFLKDRERLSRSGRYDLKRLKEAMLLLIGNDAPLGPGGGRFKGDPVTYQRPSPAGGVQLETFVPWTLVKRGLKKQVITPLDVPQEFRCKAGSAHLDQIW